VPAIHKTELGRLKARLKWSKTGPNTWEVEHLPITRVRHKGRQFFVVEHPIRRQMAFATLTAAFTVISDWKEMDA
jgi:hypothetical protein